MPAEGTELLSRRAMIAIDCTLLALWSGLVLVVLLSVVPEHVIGTEKGTKRAFTIFLPEGWAFFTRNAREPTFRFFEERPDGSLVPGNGADVRSANPLRASREDRLRGVTVGAVVTQIPKEKWTTCRGSTAECVRQLPKEPVPVMIAMHRPSYCGRAVIQETTQVPWGWRERYATVRMPARMVRVDVVCRFLSR